MNIWSIVIDHASEIVTFLVTAGAAWLKRRYDLKQIAKDNAQKDWAQNAK